jgi:hypothetical protein
VPESAGAQAAKKAAAGPVKRSALLRDVTGMMDGLNHLRAAERTFNGFRLAGIVEDYGTSRLDIDTLRQAVTRGLLLDTAAARGRSACSPVG